MTHIIQSIKNITSSTTDSKIKDATNIEPLGPYNHELIELAQLTFHKKDLSVIISGVTKRLNPLVKIANEKSGQPQPSTIESQSMRRSTSLTLPSFHLKHDSVPSRSNTFALFSRKDKCHYDLDEKTSLSLLKTCAVVLYLLQNGSHNYVDWMQSNYHTYFIPLRKLSYPPKYYETIRYKLRKIINFMEYPEQLQDNRNHIHKLRTDIMTPGVKRTSLDIDLLHVQQQQSPLRERRYSLDREYTLASPPPGPFGFTSLPGTVNEVSMAPRSSLHEPGKRRSSHSRMQPEHPSSPPRTPNPRRLSSMF
ncbi:uncharacterized protein SPAPADRAFT_62444 [Spathaspora passalidarum NRRL Y-27907]|uniref:ENTH domain-containing protein n=1 Tax=Spathaspora passalidarum (strain NRRL Y-27907 / 11-Y1) TaxID=619300 RepID=G3ARX9_SPAPN|nr:uncharacterized protein SPAPADRAFT_62444 [Spathaspora passalidarum NRRL Y-27907]EGW31828.1 hypothetical protein SPAPADRAFT_62444 [Spathaspora passalidarum NRRL Y-27907]